MYIFGGGCTTLCFNPLLIGAGALRAIPHGRHARNGCFNPLLIGAGALPNITIQNLTIDMFQSPSDRGGSAPKISSGCDTDTLSPGFNPLLIGAGALPGPPRQLRRRDRRFNPLLIGAGALPFLKFALATQQHRVYFSRTPQSNAFLSPRRSSRSEERRVGEE